MPARMMVVRLLSAIYARAKIRSVVRKAPAKAKMALWVARPWKRASPIITANPAPELTPMVFGLARELFITVCKITPAQDKPMPAVMAPNIRGILIWKSKRPVTEVRSFWIRQDKISFGFNKTLPKKRLADIIRSSRKNIPAKDKMIFFLVYIGNPFRYSKNMYCVSWKALVYAACVNKITYSERNNNALIN